MWKKTAMLPSLGIAVAIGASVLAQAAEAGASPAFEIRVITGRIESAEENLLGETTQVRIVSAVEGAFLIANEGIGEELTSHVGAIVTVTAERTHDDEGNEILSVERYHVHKG